MLVGCRVRPWQRRFWEQEDCQAIYLELLQRHRHGYVTVRRGTIHSACEILMESTKRRQTLIQVEELCQHLDIQPPPWEKDLLRRAYRVAEEAHRGQKRLSGEDYIYHPVAVAEILAQLHMDVPTLMGALLHDVVEDTSYTVETLHKTLLDGYLESTNSKVDKEIDRTVDTVVRLVDGVTKLGKIQDIARGDTANGEALSSRQAENLRKMFLATAEDPRVVLIKLADRLHNMRTLKYMPLEKQKRIAKETLEIFAPLANRIGIWQIKWELEDLSFRYTDPVHYREIAKHLEMRRAERERFVGEVVDRIKKEISRLGIEAEVTGRPKHLYSIWRKMQRKQVPVEQVYDTEGVRVIIEDNDETKCYLVLGLIHSIWRPISGEFDDYIANPKPNGYQSLHTAVVGPRGRPLEVQIRTREMHRVAELGIAAHWRYKEGITSIDPETDLTVLRLRQSILDLRQEAQDAESFIDSVKDEVLEERVFVFTPKGKLIDLPTGSTPIDFAYAIHTEIGHRCRGARVNGNLVSLSYKLRSGDQVEILTAKEGGPSRDWLNPALEFVKTSRARGKIRQWFRRRDREEAVSQGRDLLEKEVKRLGIANQISIDDLVKKSGYEKQEDFLAAIGYGDLNIQQVVIKISEIIAPSPLEEEEVEEKLIRPKKTEGISVAGLEGIPTTLARCCNPVPGDPIVGYVTRGRGVTIHRKNCPNIRNKEKERLIEVEWSQTAQETFPARIQVRAYDRPGLVRDITDAILTEHINIRNSRTSTNRSGYAMFTATLNIRDLVQLSRVLSKIEQVSNVIEAHRQAG